LAKKASDTQVRSPLHFSSLRFSEFSASPRYFFLLPDFFQAQKLLHRLPKKCTATPVDARLASTHNARNKFEQELVEPSIILAT
jgi:hypothetical protein